jgi:hypothetical protein
MGRIQSYLMNNTESSLFTPGSLDTQGPSSSRKRRLVGQTIYLKSFFCNEAQRLTKPWFLLMAAPEEGKTLKSVSACRLVRSIDAVAGTLQTVTRQRNGSILLEARTDQQIDKLSSQTTVEGLQVQVVTHPTLNLCKGVMNHDCFSSESEEDLKTFFEEKRSC